MMLLRFLPHALLAQTYPFDDAPAAPAPAPHGMSYQDLQSGFRQWNDAMTDHSFHSGSMVLLGLIGSILLLGLTLKLIERWCHRPPTNSVRRLGHELLGGLGTPWVTRLLLWWVALSTRTPIALLLLSPPHFQQVVQRLSGRASFHPIRRGGMARRSTMAQNLHPADG